MNGQGNQNIFQAPRAGHRGLLFTSTELGFGAGKWHLLDQHGNTVCNFGLITIERREWCADSSRPNYDLCRKCIIEELDWPAWRQRLLGQSLGLEGF